MCLPQHLTQKKKQFGGGSGFMQTQPLLSQLWPGLQLSQPQPGLQLTQQQMSQITVVWECFYIYFYIIFCKISPKYVELGAGASVDICKINKGDVVHIQQDHMHTVWQILKRKFGNQYDWKPV